MWDVDILHGVFTTSMCLPHNIDFKVRSQYHSFCFAEF